MPCRPVAATRQGSILVDALVALGSLGIVLSLMANLHQTSSKLRHAGNLRDRAEIHACNVLERLRRLAPDVSPESIAQAQRPEVHDVDRQAMTTEVARDVQSIGARELVRWTVTVRWNDGSGGKSLQLVGWRDQDAASEAEAEAK